MLVSPCDLGLLREADDVADAPPTPKHRKPTLHEQHVKRERDAHHEAALANARSAVPIETYGHIANFVRGAPDGQRVRFWNKVGQVFRAAVAQKQTRPIWLSTEGSGVPWLHVRMDSRPKYYHPAEFKPWDSWVQGNAPY